MNWIHPFFLFAVAAVAVPLVLHLFGRRVYKRLELPTIELLRRAIDAKKRRSRLREWLLLSLRSLLIIAAVVAVSRLLLERGIPTASLDPPRTLVILLDNSRSMGAIESGTTVFDRCRNQAERLLDSMRADDRAMVEVPVSGDGISAGVTNDRDRLRRQLREARVSIQGGSLLPTLQRSLAGVEPSSSVEAWVFTDGTSRAWSGRWEGPAGIPIHVVNCGTSQPTPNQALMVETSDPSEVRASIRRFESDSPATVSFEVWTGSNWIPRERKALDSSDGTVLFRIGSNEKGAVLGRLSLEPDALSSDNSDYVMIPEKPLIKVLVVNGNPRPESVDDAAYFTLLALRSGSESSPTNRFEAEEISPAGLNPDALQAYEGVILADAAQVDSAKTSFLLEFVQRGGHLFVGGGESYENVIEKLPISDLLPAPIRGVQFIEGERSVHLLPPEKDGPFAFLASDWDRLVGGAEFRALLLLEPLPSSNVLLRFDNGLPALAVRRFGAGSVWVWASSLGRHWNTFPTQTGYPGFLQRWISMAVESSRPQVPTVHMNSPARFQASQLGPNVKLGSARCVGCDLNAVLSPEGGWTFPDEAALWNVTGTDKEGRTRSAYIGVRGDPEESDLHKSSATEISDRLSPSKVLFGDAETVMTAGLHGRSGSRSEEQTGWIGALALLLLVFESLLAGRLPLRVILFCFLFAVPSAWAQTKPSGVQVAQVIYQGGNPEPVSMPFDPLLRKIEGMTNVEVSPDVARVQISDAGIFNYPFLYWAGDRGFPLPSGSEIERLRQFLLRGGFIVFDNALGVPGSHFETSVFSLLKAVFPAKSLRPLSKDHSIFRSFYLLDGVEGRKGDSVTVMGLDLERRTAAVYFSGDLAGSLKTGAVLPLRFGINLLYYALTLDYKQDQIHIPFLLERRK